MAPPGPLGSLPSLLTREQWVTVLILAGASLLLVPPDRPGLALVLWFLAVLFGSFVVVLTASRLWQRHRG